MTIGPDPGRCKCHCHTTGGRCGIIACCDQAGHKWPEWHKKDDPFPPAVETEIDMVSQHEEKTK